jgi:hypothetical protein
MAEKKRIVTLWLMQIVVNRFVNATKDGRSDNLAQNEASR